jgi:hypothetical protein
MPGCFRSACRQLARLADALVLGNEGRTIRWKGRVLFCCIKKAAMKTILIVEDNAITRNAASVLRSSAAASPH